MEAPGGKVPSIKRDQHGGYKGRIGKDVLSPGTWVLIVLYSIVLASLMSGWVQGQLPGREDNDLGFRLLEQGYCICYVPEAIVYHRAWRLEHESCR